MYPGSSFSHFEILTLLGEGSYAKVFKARDIRDGREVAIKILHAHLASLENVRTRFLREADVQTKLYHPNIVKVFEVVEDQGSVGMVMELIEGKTLAEAIARQKHMPFDQIARIMDQILDAVGYAHSHQIVHRDLKPSNVLMLADGTVKVSDFGIARLLHTQSAGVRTRTGMALGTSYYMSPEQVLGRKDLDHRSDIYALGCILYELLVGHPMFFEFEQQTEDPDFLIKNAHVQQPVPDPQRERPDIPAGLIAVLKQALAKKPEDRYENCTEMRVDLKKALSMQAQQAAQAQQVQQMAQAQQVQQAAQAQQTQQAAQAQQTQQAKQAQQTQQAKQVKENQFNFWDWLIIIIVLGFLGVGPCKELKNISEEKQNKNNNYSINNR